MCSPTTRLKRLVRHFGLQPKALVETITQNRGEAIAAAAIRHDCLLLSADKDFERIARLSALKLA